MLCTNCDNKKDVSFLTESFPCTDCDNEIDIEYNLCRVCGSMWKSINGVMIRGTKFCAGSDLGQVIGEVMDRLFEVLMASKEGLVENQLVNKNQSVNSMGDYVHKCIKCDGISYEVESDSFQCSVIGCGFKWEVK